MLVVFVHAQIHTATKLAADASQQFAFTAAQEEERNVERFL